MDCNFCTLLAITERTREGSHFSGTLRLCKRCAAVWDTATRAEQEKAPEPEPLEDQVRTLFEAVRYLVDNMLPQTMSDHAIKTQLVKELDAVINLGK